MSNHVNANGTGIFLNHQNYTVQRKTLMVEKSDEFDECMLNHQNFALRKFQYCIFYDYNLLTLVCQGLSHYVGTWNLEYFCPITHVRRTLLKTRIHLKEISYSIYLGHVYQRLYHRHRDQFSALCNADTTMVLKQAKRSFQY